MSTDPSETPDLSGPPRSYKLRGGRMSEARRGAMDTLLGRFAVAEAEGPLDLVALFGNENPVVLEIGFGMGGSTVTMAEAEAGTNILAADVHTAGVAALLLEIDRRELSNLRVLHGDGRRLLQERIPSAALAGVRVYFPDPWPKPRHHKRRLVDTEFAALVADRLAPGGLLHCATDWVPYAQQMAEVLGAEPALRLDVGPQPRPHWRPRTPYETRGLNRGHVVTDLLARRIP